MCISSFNNTFENFEAVAGTGKTLEVMKRFAETMQPPLVLIIGGLGCGKTYLLEAVAIEWRKVGKFARVIKFERILAGLRAGMKPHALPDYDTVLDNYCRASRLLIDDFGMGTKDTDWSKAILESIIDHRYHESLPTAITTNLDATELPPRVYSRFSDSSKSVIVLNRGKDYRLRLGRSQ
jgi:DNA replication protein DnaC